MPLTDKPYQIMCKRYHFDQPLKSPGVYSCPALKKHLKWFGAEVFTVWKKALFRFSDIQPESAGAAPLFYFKDNRGGIRHLGRAGNGQAISLLTPFQLTFISQQTHLADFFL